MIRYCNLYSLVGAFQGGLNAPIMGDWFVIVSLVGGLPRGHPGRFERPDYGKVIVNLYSLLGGLPRGLPGVCRR